MCRTVLDQLQRGGEDAHGGVVGTRIAAGSTGRAEVLPEQLVRAVDQVHLHGREPYPIGELPVRGG